VTASAIDLDLYLSAARRAVTLATRVTRAVQSTINPAAGQTLSKADDSPVTIADFAAQAIVARELVAALGPIRLVGEESAKYLRDPQHARALEACVGAVRSVEGIWPAVGAAELLDAIDVGGPELAGGPRSKPRHHAPNGTGSPTDDDGFWTLDPIDGTKGFIRGHQYSVCLAYVQRGRPVVAALACPNLSSDFERPFEQRDARGLTFLARTAHATRVVPADDLAAQPAPLAGHSADGTGAASPRRIRLVGSYSSGHNNESLMMRIIHGLEAAGLEVERPRRLDSQVKYAVVARGQADVFIRTPRSEHYREHIWDHAAGSLVAEQAGCVVTDVAGVPLDFSVGTRLEANRGIVCGPAWAHGAVVEAVRAVLPV
jgi:HAL2 family 3'(2'),5'-bisphosphate nucleotidase